MAQMNLSKEEENLINLVRKVEYGQVNVVIKKGKPVMAREITVDHKLD